ncbi:ribbon-helix-helix domain-containing protein [Candidatus Paracaedibacter symbiosus]|uniref:ribbon-helix-helix domain-containing protein n=1 Tax=Candidatus Paracaedibacter symbiosus TaxID=244582 RepID=UPI000509CE0D|nr:ribbon-helix-helix domain-containing protein [Candidatus Paracaedibacter symbiosus]
MTGIVKKSINLSGHLTSISLEPEFWDALKKIAIEEGLSLRALVQHIDHDRLKSDSIYNLSSAIRVFVLGYYSKLSAKLVL